MKIFCRFFCIIAFFANSWLYADVLVNEKQPFQYPQTTLVAGELSYKFKAKNKNFDVAWDRKAEKMNSYGFDIETPYNDFTNIGFYYRFDAFDDSGFEEDGFKFNTRIAMFLGLFGRLQYSPFDSKLLNLFARLDLGFGPTVMKFSGVSGQGAAHIGIESYINDWIGLTLSYAFIEEIGKETILGTLADEDKGFKNIVFRTSARAIFFGVKTTYF